MARPTLGPTRYFPVLTLVHLVLWGFDLSRYTGETEPTFPRLVGEFFCSWAAAVLAINFLLATRARWIERLFGGLDKVYVVHRRAGVLAAILILVHIAAIPKTTQFGPEKPLGVLAAVVLLSGVAVSVLPFFKERVGYSRWHAAHKLMGAFLFLAVGHALVADSLIRELPLVRAYTFTGLAAAVIALLYRLARDLGRPGRHGTVASVVRQVGAISDVTVRLEGAPLEFEAGQFVRIRVPRFGREWHPFTLSSEPGDVCLRLSIKQLGDFTERVAAELTEGDAVVVDGPYGCFTQERLQGREQVWLAAGIGITPFLSMAGSSALPPVRLIWSVPSEAAAAYRDELQERAAACSSLDVEFWSSDVRGYLTLEAAGVMDRPGQVYLLCGPGAFKRSLRRQLLEAGVDRSRIMEEHFEFR